MRKEPVNELQLFVTHYIPARSRILDMRSCADISNLDFPNGRFDAVIAYDTLEQATDAPRTLSEMQRVLKNGGLLLVNSPNLLSSRAALQAYQKRKIDEEKAASSKLVAGLVANIARLFARNVAQRPKFLYRTKRNQRLFKGSNANVCLNPLDLKFYLEGLGMKVISYQETKHLPSASVAKQLSSRFLADHMSRIRIVARKGARFERQ